jgi:hypothetical protein
MKEVQQCREDKVFVWEKEAKKEEAREKQVATEGLEVRVVNVSVRIAEKKLPISRGFPVTQSSVPNAEQK